MDIPWNALLFVHAIWKPYADSDYFYLCGWYAANLCYFLLEDNKQRDKQAASVKHESKGANRIRQGARV